MKNLNLKDFGAKPDGVFNNGEAFKTAFEEIAKNGQTIAIKKLSPVRPVQRQS